MTERKRERKTSDPKMLRARIEAAHAGGRPLEVDPDEVTGVIDIATQVTRERCEVATQNVRQNIAARLRTPPGGNPLPSKVSA